MKQIRRSVIATVVGATRFAGSLSVFAAGVQLPSEQRQSTVKVDKAAHRRVVFEWA